MKNTREIPLEDWTGMHKRLFTAEEKQNVYVHGTIQKIVNHTELSAEQTGAASQKPKI